jgi:anhydro-N-acetylmuramic acid kinase
MRITRALPGVKIASTERLGIHPDWVEAMAFAWLAQRSLKRQAGNLPEVTGAKGPRVLGAIYAA